MEDVVCRQIADVHLLGEAIEGLAVTPAHPGGGLVDVGTTIGVGEVGAHSFNGDLVHRTLRVRGFGLESDVHVFG